MINENTITKIISVWISIHPDHYFKHLFKSMKLAYKYANEELAELRIETKSEYPCRVNAWSYRLMSDKDNCWNTTSKVDPNTVILGKADYDVNGIKVEKEENSIILSIANKLLERINELKFPLKKEQKELIKNIYADTNEIASRRSEDPNMVAKLDRLMLSRLDDFGLEEIGLISRKIYDIKNDYWKSYELADGIKYTGERTEESEYPKDLMSQEDERRRQLWVKSRKKLLSLEDITVDSSADYVDETIPNFLLSPIKEAIRKMDLSCYKIPSMPRVYEGRHFDSILKIYANAAYRRYGKAFIVNIIMELLSVIRPKDMVVYEWLNEGVRVVALKLGSWIITKDYPNGFVVYGGEHENYKLKLMLTKPLIENSVRFDDFFSVELPYPENSREIYKIGSDVNCDENNYIEMKLTTYTGTEYVEKYGKPEKVKICQAIDEMK